VALHGLQLPQDAAVGLISRFLDPYHTSIVVVQCHFGVEFTMKSSVKAVLVNRDAAQWLLSGVRFYPGYGAYDHGYFNAESVRPSHQVIFFLLNYLILIFNDCYCMI